MAKPQRAEQKTGPFDGDFCGPDGCAPADLADIIDKDVLDDVLDDTGPVALTPLPPPTAPGDHRTRRPTHGERKSATR